MSDMLMQSEIRTILISFDSRELGFMKMPFFSLACVINIKYIKFKQVIFLIF